MALGILLALFIGISLGLLGGGGSILTVPILRYAVGLDTHQAIAVSLFVVGVTSASGMIQHARLGHVQWCNGLLFSIGAMAGAYAGGRLGTQIPGNLLLILFAGLMVLTAIVMLRKDGEAAVPNTAKIRWLPLILEGLAVGIFTGMVGAGGGFLVVPALVLLAGQPMRSAIGTSLLVIALKSFAGLAGYLTGIAIDWQVALLVTGAAVLGSFGGARLARLWPPDRLRIAFAWFTLLMAVLILAKEIPWL